MDLSSPGNQQLSDKAIDIRMWACNFLVQVYGKIPGNIHFRELIFVFKRSQFMSNNQL